jgi:hypothetical protein
VRRTIILPPMNKNKMLKWTIVKKSALTLLIGVCLAPTPSSAGPTCSYRIADVALQAEDGASYCNVKRQVDSYELGFCVCSEGSGICTGFEIQTLKSLLKDARDCSNFREIEEVLSRSEN